MKNGNGETEAKYIEKEWATYRLFVLPKDASPVQADECRKAFYAGAGSLFHTILGFLEEGEEATDADLEKMNSIQKELEGFVREGAS